MTHRPRGFSDVADHLEQGYTKQFYIILLSITLLFFAIGLFISSFTTEITIAYILFTVATISMTHMGILVCIHTRSRIPDDGSVQITRTGLSFSESVDGLDQLLSEEESVD